MLQILMAAIPSALIRWNRAFMAGVCSVPLARAGLMAATGALRRSEDDTPLQIDLYGEARHTAEDISDRMKVSPSDVVARALGILYFLLLEEDAKRRVVTENLDGSERRQLQINVRAGDAGAGTPRGG
jgi:hypothetical protein